LALSGGDYMTESPLFLFHHRHFSYTDQLSFLWLYKVHQGGIVWLRFWEVGVTVLVITETFIMWDNELIDVFTWLYTYKLIFVEFIYLMMLYLRNAHFKNGSAVS
jgi:hypothetical protein